ncbi:MAG: cytochrome P450 [Ilumatobacter sp.]|jgi:cytochrome P450
MAGETLEEMQRFEGYRVVEEVLRSDAFHAALHYRDSGPLLDGCVLTLGGAEHRERRRLQRPLFERRALAIYEHETLAASISMAFEQADQQRGPDGRPRIDLLWLTRMALVPVTAAVVGLDGIDNETDIVRLEDISRRLGEGASVEWSTRDHDDVLREALEARDEIVDAFYTASFDRRRSLVASYRRGEISAAELPIDLLTLVLLEHGDEIDEELWLREALFFVVASANTTTHSTPHVFHELMTWSDEHVGEAHLLDDDAALRHACEEALRLHGPVPALLRRAMRDAELSDGQAVGSLEDVACMLGPANTDPEMFGADAGEYNPRRAEGLSARDAHGLSFGAGSHLCSGRPLAIGLPPGTTGDAAVIGVVPRLMRELLSRGARPDPDDPPQLRTDTTARRYETYPLVFDQWPGDQELGS